LLSLVLLATLAADTRPVAVVATSKRPGADAYTQKVAERVHAQLLRNEVPGLLSIDDATKLLKGAGITDPRTCQAARPCVGKLALILGEKGVVVSVDTAKAGSLLAIVLEAVSGDGNRVLASKELTLPVAKESDEAAVPIVEFARALKAKLEEEAPKPVAKVEDAPVKTNLEPAPTPPPIVVEEGDRRRARRPRGSVGGDRGGAGHRQRHGDGKISEQPLGRRHHQLAAAE
jgi:hypothetical protein